MPGEPVRLGPFIGGINTLSDPSALSDTELVDCVNFELDLDGSLIARPPMTVHDSSAVVDQRTSHLGFVVIGGTTYHISSAGSGTYWSVDGTNWTLITSSYGASTVIQWFDRAYLPNPSGAGGYWTPSGGFIAVASMPASDNGVVLKGRMYLAPGAGTSAANNSRVYFSAVNDGTSWGGTDFINVNDGDGQRVIQVSIFNDNLIIFKNDSTYAYPFDTGPSQGILRKISGTIGATRQDCVVLYEQNLYVYHEGNVYEVINYDFSRLNSKVPFAYDPTAPSAFADPVFLSLFGDRLVVRYYNRIYVFGFRTRTWTRWESTHYFGPLRAAPLDTTAQVNVPHYAGAAITGSENIFRIDDGFDVVRSESMTCSLRTKNYDLSISHKFKRLFWWGADVATMQNITGTVTPVVHTFAATWSSLSLLQWNALYTWERPTTAPGGISTVVPTTLGGGARKFVKFMKSIRFRQVNFQLSTTTNGTTGDGPVRVFTITALVNQKQDVAAAVS